MPILVQKGLPASDILRKESIFVMTHERASIQDIRPLKIGIVNLMPTLEITETQLIRMLANTPLQVELYLLRMDSKWLQKKDLPHLEMFYKTYDEIKRERFDGLIITGAPVEMLAYEEVDYWKELTEIMDYTKKNVFSTLHICWGALAGYYYHYGIDKVMQDEKMFGVFPHSVAEECNLTRGFDDIFHVPHSRYASIPKEEIEKNEDLRIIVESEQAGVHISATENKRWIFMLGHGEYDRDTLRFEYERDLAKGKSIKVPENYFIDDDPSKGIKVNWKAHSNLFFENWLNFVYQETPYNLEELDTLKW